MARGRKAFTLVELLVVIGIIAVLIGVLLPALQRARVQANSVACMSQMRQLGTALQFFVHDHNGYLPKAWFNNEPNDFGERNSWHFQDPMLGWDYVLNSYIKNKKVFLCPNDDTDLLRGTWDDGYANLPDKPDADNIPSSYRINISNQRNAALYASKINEFRHTDKAIIFLEGTRTGDSTDSVWHHVATWESPPLSLGWIYGRVSKANSNNVFWNRHATAATRNRTDQGRANYVFLDGHAESLTWDETWVPIGPAPASAQALLSRTQRGATMWRQVYEPIAGSNGILGDYP